MARFEGFVSKHRTGTSFTALVVVCLVILTAAGGNVSFQPKRVGLAIISVFEGAFSDTGSFFARTVNSIGELKKLRASYDQLQEQLAQYQTIERDIVELRQENKILRDQLGFADTLEYEHVAAQVIGKDPGNIFSTIVISKGSRQGIAKDMPVVAFQDGFQGLVGKVVVVSPDTAIVQPILDPSCFVAARLQSSRYEGLVSGAGAGQNLISMSYVPKRAREDIKYGDLVITSGMNSIYPKGIYVGRVRSIGAKEWETSLDLAIEPIVDFSTLEYVFVLTKAIPEDQSGDQSPTDDSGAQGAPAVGASQSGASRTNGSQGAAVGTSQQESP